MLTYLIGKYNLKFNAWWGHIKSASRPPHTINSGTALSTMLPTSLPGPYSVAQRMHTICNWRHVNYWIFMFISLRSCFHLIYAFQISMIILSWEDSPNFKFKINNILFNFPADNESDSGYDPSLLTSKTFGSLQSLDKLHQQVEGTDSQG